MICITEIKTVDVDRDFLMIHKMQGIPALAEVIGSEPPEMCEVEEEMIIGRDFINARGDRFCIGMSAQVQNAIGLPMAAFANMSKTIDKDATTIYMLRIAKVAGEKRIAAFETAGLWQRIKYVFTRDLQQVLV